jgi:hypothetical protein
VRRRGLAPAADLSRESDTVVVDLAIAEKR